MGPKILPTCWPQLCSRRVDTVFPWRKIPQNLWAVVIGAWISHYTNCNTIIRTKSNLNEDSIQNRTRRTLGAFRVQLAPLLESLLTTPPYDHHSIFHNPRVELRCEYQCNPACDQRFVFDIWSPRLVRRCRFLRIIIISTWAGIHTISHIFGAWWMAMGWSEEHISILYVRRMVE